MKRIIETRWYNGATGYQVNYIKNKNDVGTWDSVEIIDPTYGTVSESNRTWIKTWYPEIKADLSSDPVAGWRWADQNKN